MKPQDERPTPGCTSNLQRGKSITNAVVGVNLEEMLNV